MKKKDIRIGMQVVVNDLTDTIIYVVEEIAWMRVRLSYQDQLFSKVFGKLDGGWVDISLVEKPTPAQLAMNLKSE